MLVLARRKGERLLIGEDVEVTVVSVRGDQVRLGISAPRTVAVRRAELVEQVAAENRAAARSTYSARRRAPCAEGLKVSARSADKSGGRGKAERPMRKEARATPEESA